VNLTKGQTAGLEMARKLKGFNSKPRINVLAGYAGTGKTTLLRIIAEELGYPIVVAPTGKAALRVREATGIKATTLHSWMYKASENEQTGEVTYEMKPREQIDPGVAGILVIDEASMVGRELWEDIYETCQIMRMNILIVGDPFQLPPVTKKKDDEGQSHEFNLLSEHFVAHDRVLLTEVVRQALENPIIRASMAVREGDPATAIFQLPRIKAADLVEKAAQVVRYGGAVICHSNDTRNKLNVALRRALNRPDNRLVSGEPLLILQNNYRLMRFNGEITVFKEWLDPPAGEHKIKDWIRKQEATGRFGVAQFETTEFDSMGRGVLCEDQVFGRLDNISGPPLVKMARILYGGNAPDMSVAEAMALNPDAREMALGYPFIHANLGYAMTCHKAQGSEYNSVVVALEPSVPLYNSEGKRWTYTALTRARENVFVCLGAKI
jgi:exodeoxyribonuclease-5